jgi:MOSC domain-containing protein YiiM
VAKAGDELDNGEAPAVVSRLLATLPQRGRVDWIGLREMRRETPVRVTEAEVKAGHGFTGDHGRGGKRAVTLIQAEHLAAVGSLLGRKPLDPCLLRRNLVVSGINLLALRNRRFHIGDVVLEGSGFCHPCSRMEEALGPGGFNAMRGHGGITASVISGGVVREGDPVRLAGPES